MNKQDLILKDLRILINGDYYPEAEEFNKEYDSIYNNIKQENCCEMPEENDVLVSNAEGVKEE